MGPVDGEEDEIVKGGLFRLTNDLKKLALWPGA